MEACRNGPSGPGSSTGVRNLAHSWRGVNLGGWLVNEPGTAKALFASHVDVDGREALCEWDLMEILRRKGVAEEEMLRHRETHTTRMDFRRIQRCGLNAVRLPIGYWIVMGPSEGEPYVGSALKYVDRAVAWAEECNLQIVLDFHGCPGGESGDAPCGRRQRPHGTWQWTNWDFEKSLLGLEILARRYSSRAAVTGIEVCNEPSPLVPTVELCRYYDRAVDVIRAAGMPSERVAVLLPLFQRSVENFLVEWNELSGSRHENICFDLHYYHCFGNEWNGKSMAQQLRAVQAHATELQSLPAVVGEWSLALGLASRTGHLPDEDARRLFGRSQLAAYEHASHGWFFWNWSDAHGTEWDWQRAYLEGSFFGSSQLPAWDGIGEDPLEDCLDPPPQEPRVKFGDAVFLRAYHGRFVDFGGVGAEACARWSDRGRWQRLTIWPAASTGCSPSASARRADDLWGEFVVDGSVVNLLAHTGHYVAVSAPSSSGGGEFRVVDSPDMFPDAAAEFVLHVQGSGVLRHRGKVFLENRATSHMVDVDGGDTGVRARWQDYGEWQRFVVEKVASPTSSTSQVLEYTSEQKRDILDSAIQSAGRFVSGTTASAAVHAAVERVTGDSTKTEKVLLAAASALSALTTPRKRPVRRAHSPTPSPSSPWTRSNHSSMAGIRGSRLGRCRGCENSDCGETTETEVVPAKRRKWSSMSEASTSAPSTPSPSSLPTTPPSARASPPPPVSLSMDMSSWSSYGGGWLLGTPPNQVKRQIR